jgi:hypothetical protein
MSTVTLGLVHIFVRSISGGYEQMAHLCKTLPLPHFACTSLLRSTPESGSSRGAIDLEERDEAGLR